VANYPYTPFNTTLLNTFRTQLNEFLKNVEYDFKDSSTKLADAQSTANTATTTSSNALSKAVSAETKANSLQQQVDNLIIGSGTSQAEVLQARTDLNGITYGTVKARVDAEQVKVDTTLKDQKAIDTGASSIAEMEYKGINFTSITSGQFQSQRSTDLLTYFNGLGGDTVAIVCTWFQPTLTSTTISRSATKTVPDADVIKAIRDAKALGMKVMLKPHVDVDTGEWRGEIYPSDWAAWFSSYQTFLNTYATIAQNEGVELLCIGTELAKASKQTTRFQTAINAVRGIYTGKLTYAATAFKGDGTDEFQSVAFWSDLDYAGLDAYFPMTNKNNPSVEEIIYSWSSNKNSTDLMKLINDWRVTHGKPVIFTEIGCTRVTGANTDPSKWDWEVIEVNDQEQANYVEAMFQVWNTNADWMKGFFWWRLAFSNQDSFTFEGKASETNFKNHMLYENKKVTSLSRFATIGGSKALSKQNHENLANPHPQYSMLAPNRTAETNGTTAGQWAKIADITFTGQYKYVMAKISFFSGSAGYTTTQRGHIFLRAKQQAAMGSAPTIQIRLSDFANISTDDIRTRTIQNDSSATKIELYIKVKYDFDRIFFNPYHIEKSATLTVINWYSEVAYVSSLPAGAENIALQDRTVVSAWHPSSQSMTALQWTKVAFTTELSDYRSEYDATNSKFVASKTGIYQIAAGVRMTSPSAQQRSLAVYVNGTMLHRMCVSSGTILVGSLPVRLSANDYVEIYLNTPDAVTIESNQQDTFLTITD
jgi:hypothetical protein